MRTKKIIKKFIFEEINRSSITLGPNVRLHPTENDIRLEETTSGYSTNQNLYFKTWIFNPGSVVNFTGFDVEATNYKKYDGTFLTSLGFRLSNGVNEYFWNGTSWGVNTTDWNTENEVSSNISSFDSTLKKIQVIVNLVTSDSLYTPSVNSISILYDSVIDFQDDLLYNSVVPYFENVKPIADFVITKSVSSNTVDLNDFTLDTPYNIVDIDSCFNYTDDQTKSLDIFSSYDSNTKVITFSTTVDSGKLVWIKFIHQPVVAISTDQEYVEVSEVPAIHILNFEVTQNYLIPKISGVRNKGDGTAIKTTKIRQKTYEFTVASVTGSAIDQQRLQDEIRAQFDNNTFINFRGLDENYTIYISREFATQTEKKEMSVYTSVFRFVVKDVVYLMGVEDANIIERFVISGDVNTTVN